MPGISIHYFPKDVAAWQNGRVSIIDIEEILLFKQLFILWIDFAIENKTQTQQAKHSVTGTFCFNLDLSEHRRGEIVFVSVR